MNSRRRTANIAGGLLQLVPAVYWIFAEGGKSIYEAFHFFPHYLVMLLLSAAAAAIQWKLCISLFRVKRCCAEEGMWCFLIPFGLVMCSGFFAGEKQTADIEQDREAVKSCGAVFDRFSVI